MAVKLEDDEAGAAPLLSVLGPGWLDPRIDAQPRSPDLVRRARRAYIPSSILVEIFYKSCHILLITVVRYFNAMLYDLYTRLPYMPSTTARPSDEAWQRN